jgi:hypothetical protein
MEKKSNIWEWVAVLGGAGVLYYLYSKNKTTTVTTTTVATPVISPVSSLPASTTASVIDPGVTQPVTVTVTPDSLLPVVPTVATATPTNAATYSANQQQVIDYFKSDLDEANLNQFLNNEANFTPAEWAGLYDLLVNDWEGGQGNTPARVQFWNNWRTKYHILDGTYS